MISMRRRFESFWHEKLPGTLTENCGKLLSGGIVNRIVNNT